MSVTKDPEENEIKTLRSFTGDLAGKRVLEIGAGYGRLTWRYAALAGEVVGIDPDADKIARAKREMPAPLHHRVTMLETTLEDFHGTRLATVFDVAIMSWAL